MGRGSSTPRGAARLAPGITIALLAAATLPARPAESAAPVAPPPSREIVERVGPAVALIKVETESESRQGSGFVLDRSGLVVTALHVIDGAKGIEVSFPGGPRLESRTVQAFDIEKDVALLRVDTAREELSLPAVSLAAATHVKPGDSILVIGSPLGLEQTVSDGIVSAWREPEAPRPADEEEEESTKPLLPACRLIQITAAVSPGSSGGPVLDDNGEVIGVATSGMLYGLAGLNFAVPASEVKKLLGPAESMDLWTFRERVRQRRLDLARPEYDEAVFSSENGDLDGAMRHLSAALRLFPGYAEALVMAGSVAMAGGDLERANRFLERAVKADKESANAWFHLGRLRETKARDTNSSSMFESAAEAYLAALSLDPGHAQAALSLAVIRLRNGETSRAEELLVIAIEADDSLVEAHYLLGEIHLQRGEIAEASKAFEAALWEDDTHALSHFGLARAYYGPGKWRKAQLHWDKFLDLTVEEPSLQATRLRAMEIVAEHYPRLVNR